MRDGHSVWKLVLLLALFSATLLHAGEWTKLLNGTNLDGWQIVGGGNWSVLSDGTLVGQSDPEKPFQQQSWLYTKREFTQYDLHIEYWMKLGSNSGISIGDRSRGRHAVPGPASDPHKTPARIAYEINLDNGQPVDYDISGSLYLIAKAVPGIQNRTDWNSIDIQVRKDLIRVRVNGKIVVEHPGLPDRPKAGPIGLQLHDSSDVIMFRNIRVSEVP